MSFSFTVKNDLCRFENNNKCCALSELSATIQLNGIVAILENGEANIKITTENAAFARRIYSQVKKVCGLCPEIIIRKSKKLKKHVSYILVITHNLGSKILLGNTNIIIDKETGTIDFKMSSNIKKTCCRKAFLRGAFLAAGSVSNPEKTYHLEITSHSLLLAQNIKRMMSMFRLNARIIKRKGSYVIYLKEGENIVDFFNIIGAHTALMELENVRILKDMRNNVNRMVNCETANLDKTVNASVRQVENINYIFNTIGFDKLPKSLREVAEVRLTHDDSNLVELGQLLNPPLGKSGVNHRLRKLDTIAENERKLRE